MGAAQQWGVPIPDGVHAALANAHGALLARRPPRKWLWMKTVGAACTKLDEVFRIVGGFQDRVGRFEQVDQRLALARLRGACRAAGFTVGGSLAAVDVCET